MKKIEGFWTTRGCEKGERARRRVKEVGEAE